MRYLFSCFGCRLDSITFIDLEYGGPNFRGFDIGDFFCEFAGKNCEVNMCICGVNVQL